MKKILFLFITGVIFSACGKSDILKDYTCKCTKSVGTGSATHTHTIQAFDKNTAEKECTKLSGNGIICNLE